MDPISIYISKTLTEPVKKKIYGFHFGKANERHSVKTE